MRAHPLLLIAGLLAAPAAAQTDVLVSIPRPAGAPTDWASRLFALPDLDGDGVGELGLGRRHHGAGMVAWVHSGVSGAQLFDVAVPNVPLFLGQNLVPVDDRDGDGVDDLVLLGTHSGASNSPDGWIQVHSGADGALLQHLEPPAGIVLIEGPSIPFGDVDGDGHTDVLCNAIPVASIGSPHVQLVSGASGAALYSGVVEDPGSSIGNRLVRLEDRDGDGVDDFATTGTDALGSRVGSSYSTSTPNSTGKAASLHALGSASIARDQLLLEAHGVVPASFGLFFYGPTVVQVPFGQGFRCVGGGATGLARLPAEVSSSAGRLSHRLDYGAPPNAATTITPGSPWNSQAWFRDPGLAPGFQTSDAVTVLFLP